MLDIRETQKSPAALMYDFDDVINNPREENPEPYSNYIIDENGNMGGTIIGITKLRRIMQFCIAWNIPLYLITARPERAEHKNFIIQQIQELNGFDDGIGGFKIANINCLGLEEYNEFLQRPHVENLIVKDKLTRIKEIHQKELIHLPRNRILFIDDDLRNIEPAKEAGYSTIHAHIGNDEHHDMTLDFLNAIINIPTITTQGNYAVLEDHAKFNINGISALGNDEFWESAEEEDLNNLYWRKRSIPDLSNLVKTVSSSARDTVSSNLSLLGFKQSIFFTNNIELIKKQILNNSYGTINCIEDLTNKKLIILVGSEGKRKIEPLINALRNFNYQLFESTAIIGLPADSGVARQPVGHEEIILGCENRLNQARYFGEGLYLLLDSLEGNQPKNIISMAIENGIGLFPVEEISNDGKVHVSNIPISSFKDNKTLFHFYDQAHILCDYTGKIYHEITKPTRINYTLVSDNLQELENYFSGGKATNQYYLKQSEWSKEMLRRLESENPNSAYPYRYEDSIEPLSSNDLIETVLYELFKSTLQPIITSNKSLKFFSNHHKSACKSSEEIKENENTFSI